MTRFERAIQHYWALHPQDFQVLDLFKLKHHFRINEEPGPSLELEIKFRATFHPNEDQKRLKLVFSGVQTLGLDIKGHAQFFLKITSIHELHWERLKYRVSDEEESQLSFYCEDFEASLEE